MLVGYDYSSGEENDYLPDDSVIIEKPKSFPTKGEPKSTKSLIGAPKLKATSVRDPPMEPNAKKPKLFSSSSRLQDILPEPVHSSGSRQVEKEEQGIESSNEKEEDEEEFEKEEESAENGNEKKLPEGKQKEDKEEILDQEIKQQTPLPEVKYVQHFQMPAKQSKVQQSILQQIQQQKIQQQQQQQQQQQLQPQANPNLAYIQQQYNQHQQYIQQQHFLQRNPQYQLQLQLQQQQLDQQQQLQKQLQQQLQQQTAPSLGIEQGPQGRPPVEYTEYYEHVEISEVEKKNRWGEMRGVTTSDQVLEIRAGDIHNGQFSRTELAHKNRLEKMSVNINKQMSNRRGQLSVIAMEAERQSLLDEERREAQKAMRKDTMRKYGW